LKNNDTLKDIRIKKNYRLTNHKTVTFKKSALKNYSYTVDGIFKYFDGKDMYYSIQEKTSHSLVFVKFFADGIYKAGESVDSKGNLLYFISNSEDLVYLKSDEDLITYIKKNIPKFSEFRKSYENKIVVSYKSLGELVSAINEFLDPKTYKKEKYKYRQSFKFGLNLYPYNYNISTKDSEYQLHGAQYISTGLSLENRLSEHFSAYYCFSGSWQNYTDNDLLFNYISYVLEAHPEYYILNNRIVNLKISPGLSIAYNYNLHENYNRIGGVSKFITISPYTFDYLLDIKVEFNKYINFNLGVHSSKFNIIEQGSLSKPEYIITKLQGIRFGFTYNFKTKL